MLRPATPPPSQTAFQRRRSRTRRVCFTDGLVLVGFAMVFAALPWTAPGLFERIAADGSSTRALWASVMACTHGMLGAVICGRTLIRAFVVARRHAIPFAKSLLADDLAFTDQPQHALM